MNASWEFWEELKKLKSSVCFSLMKTTCSIPHAVGLPNTYHVLGVSSNPFCILILPPIQIFVLSFFPVNSAGSPDFSLGSQGLAALSPPTCLIFCVSLFLLHCQLSLLFKKHHIYDPVARVWKCRVHEVLPSEQEQSCSCCCLSLAKQDRLGSLKQRVWDELGADIPEGKRFCFSVAQTSSNNISVLKKNSLSEHSSLSWPLLAQSLAWILRVQPKLLTSADGSSRVLF